MNQSPKRELDQEKGSAAWGAVALTLIIAYGLPIAISLACVLWGAIPRSFQWMVAGY